MSEDDATHRRLAGYILIGMGVLLVVLGIGLTIWQFWIVVHAPKPEFPMRGLSASATGLSLQTTYIGAILIGIGAVLMVSGSLLFRETSFRNSN